MSIKVYVGNLPDNTSEETLRDLFGGYGDIKDLIIIRNYAFIHFDKEEEANQAVKDLNHTKLLGQLINVEVSKSKKSKGIGGGGGGGGGARNRSDDKGSQRNRRGGQGNRQNGPPTGPPLGGLGGILGAAPGAAPLAGVLGNNPTLNILSAVNALAVAAEQQRNLETNRLSGDQDRGLNRERERDSRDQPDPDVRVRREVVHTRDVPNASRLGLGNGYVIYERYYVDPSHPLLKGLPLPEYPRITDTTVARERDYYRQPEAVRRDEYRDLNTDEYRDRSPLQDQDYDRLRDRDYGRAEYFERR